MISERGFEDDEQVGDILPLNTVRIYANVSPSDIPTNDVHSDNGGIGEVAAPLPLTNKLN